MTGGLGGLGGRGRRRLAALAGMSGAGLLAASFSSETGSPRFYALTSALAATWAAAGLSIGPGPAASPAATAAAPLRLIAEPVATGFAAFGLFYGAATVVRRIQVLERAIGGALRYMHEGSAPLVLLTAVVNGAAEEVFFHGALWNHGDGRPLASTTAAYTVVTAASGNPALVLGGAVTSVIFGLERYRSGGYLAPAVAHMTWSLLMLAYLPPLFRPLPSASPRSRACRRRCGRAGRVRADGTVRRLA